MRPFVRMSGPVAPVALLLGRRRRLALDRSGAAARARPRQPDRLGSDAARRSIAGCATTDRAASGPTAARRWVAAAGAASTCADSLIVKFRPGTSAALAARACWRRWTAPRGPRCRTPTSTSSRSPAAPTPKPWRSGSRAQPDVEYAQARYRVRPMFVPNDPLYSLPVELSRARHGAGVGHQPRRLVRRRRRRARQRRGLSAARVLRYNGIAWQRDDGVVFPALGPVDIPFAAAPDLGADRFVAPARFHLGRPAALRPGRATARTSRAPSASSPTTASASRAWPSTCG